TSIPDLNRTAPLGQELPERLRAVGQQNAATPLYRIETAADEGIGGTFRIPAPAAHRMETAAVPPLTPPGPCAPSRPWLRGSPASPSCRYGARARRLPSAASRGSADGRRPALPPAR